MQHKFIERSFSMRVYVIGARGRFGQAISNEFSDANIIELDRRTYESWVCPGVDGQVSQFFDKKTEENTYVFVASGILDPSLSEEELRAVNYYLPRNIIDGATKLGIKVITFGTVMELIRATKNQYIRSKIELADYIEEIGSPSKRALHIQMHTLYGSGLPNRFMFLGQILDAILTNRQFHMTSGLQLREYHHSADEAQVVRFIATSDNYGVTQISHGKPLSLREIAEGIFESFSMKYLLHTGSLPEPEDDNYSRVFTSSDIPPEMSFRDTLPAIIKYVKDCYSSQKEQL
jgi:nucleoside-diphosphate-sugar epimerase